LFINKKDESFYMIFILDILSAFNMEGWGSYIRQFWDAPIRGQSNAGFV